MGWNFGCFIPGILLTDTNITNIAQCRAALEVRVLKPPHAPSV